MAEAAPEQASPTATASLEVSTDVLEVAPGGTVVYTLRAGCDASEDRGCRAAVLTDTVPAPLVLTDARIVDPVSTGESATISGNHVYLEWRSPLGDGTRGIVAGETRILQVTAELPPGVSPDVFDVPVFDDARLDGENFEPVAARAQVTPVETVPPVEPPYDGPVGSLTIAVESTGPGAPYFSDGPFRIHVSCTLDQGEAGTSVVYDEDLLFGEDQPHGYRSTIGELPTGSVCAVTEPVIGLANSHEITGSPATIGDGTTRTVTVVNTFLVGSLRVDKTVVGDGAEMRGSGPFVITLRCMQGVSFQYVDIPGGATRTLDAAGGWTAVYDILPAGRDAACSIEETDDGGADAKRLINPRGYDNSFHDGGSFVGFFYLTAGAEVVYTIENTFDAMLPATGADAGMLWAAGALALVLIGGGALLVVAPRRRRG